MLPSQLAGLFHRIYRRKRHKFISLMTQNSNNMIKIRKFWKRAKKDHDFRVRSGITRVCWDNLWLNIVVPEE